MRYIVDTNILTYIIIDRYNLSKDIFYIVTDYENQIYVSSESVKELICLFKTGRVKVKGWKYASDIFDSIEKGLGYTISYVKKEHLKTLASLVPAPNHNDHCDHVIIAHALTEKMPLISSDGKFKDYERQGLKLIFNKR
jgi:PIN domain nuclease of toxin-antitoxin system